MSVPARWKRRQGAAAKRQERPAIGPGDFVADKHAGAYPHGMNAAPYADGRRPISPRTGRPAAQASCEAEYRQSLDSIPFRREGWTGGFWDFDQEAEQGPRRGPPRPAREDAEAMAAFVAKHSATRMTGHELDIYKMFWLDGLSYAEVAKEIGSNAKLVYACIKRIRIKRARAAAGR